MDYQKLIKLSIKGDQQAIKDLLVLAKNLNEENKLLERWIEKKSLSLRPLPRIVDGMNKKFIFTTVDFDIYHESDPGGKLWPLTSLLDSALDEVNGIDRTEESTADYAGATRPSNLAYLMENYFGINHRSSLVPEIQTYFNEQEAQFLEELKALPLKARIWADILADEVENRFQAAKTFC